MAQFLDGDCRAFQTGPACCDGSTSVVLSCANTGGGTSLCEVYCQPDSDDADFMHDTASRILLDDTLFGGRSAWWRI